MNRYEIKIAGFGGQGVITLSKMIAHAGAIHSDLTVAQTEAYSAAARGGKCWAEVVVDLDKGEKLIDYPKALEPYDFLIVLSQAAAEEIKPTMVKNDPKSGYVIWDNKMIEKFRGVQKMKALAIPVQELAIELFGGAVYGNAILFGAFTKIAGIFPVEAAKKTLEYFVPKATLAKNLEAFALGMAKAEEFLNSLAGGSPAR